LRKNILFCFTALVAGAGILSAQSPPAETAAVRWYRSNSSGITLELIPSRLAALRNEYCLSVERANPNLIPEIISRHYDSTFAAELRILYENGKENRRQWIFRDDRGIVRLVASGSSGFFGAEEPPAIISAEETEEETRAEAEAEEKTESGFIEIRNGEGFTVRELRYDEDHSEWEFRYSYTDQGLQSAETWYKEPTARIPLNESESSEENEDENQERPDAPEEEESSLVLICTDYYSYSRPRSLRAIERIISFPAGEKVRIPFPGLGPVTSKPGEIITPRIAYVPEFLSGVYTGKGERAIFTLDSRGRILTEIWKDQDDEVIGEILNTWEGDRLISILWKSGDEELLVEYEYDNEGNRMAERNFRQGVLERSVASINGREIEEIYKNGILILRAVWEKGLKISEERVSPGRPR